MMNDIGQAGPWAGMVGRRGSDSVVLEALSQFVEPATIRHVITQAGKDSPRIRRLPAIAVVWLIIAMAIYRPLENFASTIFIPTRSEVVGTFLRIDGIQSVGDRIA